MAHNKLRFAFNTLMEGSKVAPRRVKGSRVSSGISVARLQVVGSGSLTDSPALALTVGRGGSAQSLYLFNLNYRGKQGLRKSSSSVLKALFFTGLDWDRLVLLTMTTPHSSYFMDERVHMHGPNGLEKFMTTVYSFALSLKRQKEINSHAVYCEEGESHYADDNITVKKVVINPTIGGDSSKKNASASYVCQISGRFQPALKYDKLKNDFGLTPPEREDKYEKRKYTKLLTRLKLGKAITHPITGETIDSNEVTTTKEPQTFIVLDCPTHEHFDIIGKSDSFVKHFDNATSDTPCLVVHITPSAVFSSRPYQEWLQNFGACCDHLIMNEMNKDCANGATTHQANMNRTCDELFPPVNEALIASKDEIQAGGALIQARTGMHYNMSWNRDNFWITDENGASDDNTLPKYEKDMDETVEDAADEVSCKLDLTPRHENGYYPRLVVLGCGASAPQKYRTQPGFLFRVDDKSSILLDCGGNTPTRIYQQFGQGAEDVLLSIKGVFLSHYHMDHHAGFIRMMKEVARIRQLRKKSFEENIKIYCLMPMNMVMFYDSYCKSYLPQVYDMVVFCAVEKVRHEHVEELDTVSSLCAVAGLKSFTPIPVTHGVICYGASLVTQCGKKVVYSSDTLPMNKRLIYEGRDTDLLIHDCLYVDEEWEMDAQLRHHSYLKATLATSSAMQAKFTLLTHFAPFLPVLPVSNLPEEYADKVACAFDFLNISLSDLNQLPKLEPVLLALYKDSIKRSDTKLAGLKQRQTYRTETIQRLSHLV